ncbi:MAG: BON domain-containing protein [Firmicutes bacterium]|nr:BON domain-containing protein [Bacillota bacterium]
MARQVEDRLTRRLAEAGLAGIGAEVRNGTVQLVGRARSQGAVEAALRLARGAPGVKNVYSSVRIEG